MNCYTKQGNHIMRKVAKKRQLSRSIHVKLTGEEFNEIKRLAAAGCRSKSGQVRLMIRNAMELTLP